MYMWVGVFRYAAVISGGVIVTNLRAKREGGSPPLLSSDMTYHFPGQSNLIF
jgi:hypothetical protein